MRAFSGILASAAIAGTLALTAAPAQAAPTLPSTGSGMIDAGTDILQTGLDMVTDLMSSLSGSMGS
ncbi:hypothetical protein [Nocardia sp. NPDC051750]|uniref:hypothetical protein n=1 Tax=Nocardia sp. NPDC051750 TaxID=3364325 RepID=UPI00379F1C98